MSSTEESPTILSLYVHVHVQMQDSLGHEEERVEERGSFQELRDCDWKKNFEQEDDAVVVVELGV